MAKAPYVRPRMKGNVRVYDIRPTAEVLDAFPHLTRENYTGTKEKYTKPLVPQPLLQRQPQGT